jgi:hypothetical protein
VKSASMNTRWVGPGDQRIAALQPKVDPYTAPRAGPYQVEQRMGIGGGDLIAEGGGHDLDVWDRHRWHPLRVIAGR